MSFSGDLNSFSLADVFQNLSNNQQSGILRVYDEETEKHLFFSQGSVRTVSTGKSRCARIGQILLARDAITQEQLDNALAFQKEDKNLLIGEILLKQGACENEAVESALKFQISEEVYDLFNWKSARFEFSEGSTGTAVFGRKNRASEIKLNTSSLIMEAARRLDEWGRINSVVTSLMMVPLRCAEIPADAEIDAGSRKVYDFCDGNCNVDKIAIDSCLGLYTVTQSLAKLIQDGLVRDSEVDEIKANAEKLVLSGNPDGAALLYKWLLERDGFNKEVAELLVEALEGAGSPVEAAGYCRKLGKANMDDGDFQQALLDYEKAGKLTTLTGSDMDSLAELYIVCKKERSAEDIWLNRARSLLDSKHIKEAIEVCSKAREFIPESEDLVSLTARIYLEAGDSHNASVCYEELADIHEARKNTKAAVSACRSVLKLDGSRSDIRNRIERLQTRDIKYRRQKSYRAAIFIVILLFALIAGGAVFVEMNTRRKMTIMENRTSEILKTGRDVNLSYEKRIKSLEVFRSEWESFDPGFSFSDFSARIKLNTDIVKEEIENLKNKGLEQKKLAVEQDRALYQKAFQLMKKGRTEDLESAQKILQGLISSEYDNEWVKKSVELLEKINSTLAEAENLYKSLSGKSFSERFVIAKEILRKFPFSSFAEKVTIPVKLQVSPALPAKVFLNSRSVGRISQKGIVLELPPGKPFEIGVQRKGFGNQQGMTSFHGAADFTEKILKPYINIKIKRIHRWVQATGDPIFSNPIFGSLRENKPVDTVFVASAFGTVYAYSVQSGQMIWKFNDEKANFEFRSAPYLYKDKIFILDFTGRLVCLERQTGKLIWPEEQEDHAYAESSVAGVPLYHKLPFYENKLFCMAGTNDGKIICFSTERGKMRWEPYSTGSRLPVRSNIVYYDSMLIFVAGDGSIHLIQSDSTRIDVIRQKDGFRPFLIEDKGFLFAVTESGVLHCWQLKPKLKSVWVQSRSLGSPASLILKNDIIICQFSDSSVASFSRYSGKIIDFVSAETEKVKVSPVVHNNFLIVPVDSTIFSRDVYARFKTVWKYSTGRKASVSGIASNEKHIVFTDEKGYIYLFDNDNIPD